MAGQTQRQNAELAAQLKRALDILSDYVQSTDNYQQWSFRLMYATGQLDLVDRLMEPLALPRSAAEDLAVHALALRRYMADRERYWTLQSPPK